MTIHYDDLTRAVKTHEATRWEPADYEEYEEEYDYDVDDDELREVLADFIDSDKSNEFEDYDSLYAYIDGNFDYLCNEKMDDLRDYYRKDAQEEFERNSTED